MNWKTIFYPTACICTGLGAYAFYKSYRDGVKAKKALEESNANATKTMNSLLGLTSTLGNVSIKQSNVYSNYSDMIKLIKEMFHKNDYEARSSFDILLSGYIAALNDHINDVQQPLYIYWAKSNPWKGGSGLNLLLNMCGITNVDDNVQQENFRNFINYVSKYYTTTKATFTTYDEAKSFSSSLTSDITGLLAYEVEAFVLCNVSTMLYTNNYDVYSNQGFYNFVGVIANWRNFWSQYGNLYMKASAANIVENIRLLFSLCSAMNIVAVGNSISGGANG